MNKVCVFSVIFPANLPFFEAFLESLSAQTFKAFDLLLLNDGVEGLNEHLKSYSHLRIETIPVGGTMQEIRTQGLNLLSRLPYDYIVFQDSDDTMSANRIADAVNLLKEYPIVFHDVALIDAQGKVMEEHVWKKRFEDSAVIDKNFLTDKNVLGMGNTALRAAILEPVTIGNQVKVPDWYFFMQIIGEQQALFSSSAQVYYRQHEQNLAGIRRLSAGRFFHIIEVKKSHYKAMQAESPEFARRYEGLLKIEKHFQQSPEQLQAYLIKMNQHPFPFFWWEEINELEHEYSTDRSKEGL